MDSLSIILPAFNEAGRLPRTFSLIKEALNQGIFKPLNLTEIIVVDDGSTDQTRAVCESHRSLLPELQCLPITPNQGKGNAIHSGIANAHGKWVLIADADSATPWDQFQKLWKQIEKENSQIAIGSRDLPESDVRSPQSWLREHMGKTFNLIVRLITGLPYRDTQCGFKLILAEKTRPFLMLLKIKRFAWDVEFLMYAKKNKLKISEVPVVWEHQDASRVHIIRDSLEMLIRVIGLRFRI